MTTNVMAVTPTSLVLADLSCVFGDLDGLAYYDRQLEQEWKGWECESNSSYGDNEYDW